MVPGLPAPPRPTLTHSRRQHSSTQNPGTASSAGWAEGYRPGGAVMGRGRLAGGPTGGEGVGRYGGLKVQCLRCSPRFLRCSPRFLRCSPRFLRCSPRFLRCSPFFCAAHPFSALPTSQVLSGNVLSLFLIHFKTGSKLNIYPYLFNHHYVFQQP